MKTIVDKDFGICPRCGGKMLYMLSTYQLAVPSPGGTNISQVLGEDKDITAVCSKCQHKVTMTSSIYGITTKEYRKLKEDQDRIREDQSVKNNIIGYISSKD